MLIYIIASFRTLSIDKYGDWRTDEIQCTKLRYSNGGKMEVTFKTLAFEIWTF